MKNTLILLIASVAAHHHHHAPISFGQKYFDAPDKNMDTADKHAMKFSDAVHGIVRAPEESEEEAEKMR